MEKKLNFSFDVFPRVRGRIKINVKYNRQFPFDIFARKTSLNNFTWRRFILELLPSKRNALSKVIPPHYYIFSSLLN